MKTSILMVTYRKDLEFAELAMQSTAKFATGFHDRILVVPSEDVDMFTPAADLFGFDVRGFDERTGKGMLHHMAIICEADLWCWGADFILHQDADCVFTDHVTPADYFQDNKPVLLREPYEDFKQWAHRYSWKACVRNATGIDPEWETMCRHPSVHAKEVYATTRGLIQNHTGMHWMEYILSCKNEFPQTFAEFPTLGAVALLHYPHRYSWVDKKGNDLTPPQPPEKMLAFWSHGGLDKDNDRHPGRTPRQMIAEILKQEGPTR